MSNNQADAKDGNTKQLSKQDKTMSTQITHHGVTFDIDTADWSDEQSSVIAETALVDGLTSLSEYDVSRIAAAWTDVDKECDSRNARDDVSEIVEAIENAAYNEAVEGWASTPNNGHNCGISPVYS